MYWKKMRNYLTREMAEVIDWLSANKFSLNISQTEYMSDTDEDDSTDCFKIKVNGNHIERALSYKFLGVIK